MTWDKLQKRGFQSPPRCSLCKQENETQDHLLNSCPYAQLQWDEARNLFGKSNRDPNDIKQTIFHWGNDQFSCSIVRRIWSLAIGFVIWFLWKERNQRIFRDKNNPPGKIWEKIQRAIRETILAENWEEEEWNANPKEKRILARLNIEYNMIYPRKERHQRAQTQSQAQFKYPGENFIKLNFDGASKGNPGLAGFGGIFRDSMGRTRWVYADKGGIMTNNEA